MSTHDETRSGVQSGVDRARFTADARLHVVSPGAISMVVPLGAAPMRLGRAPGDGAAIAHPTVSRVHAEVRWTGERHTIADRGSRNGSRLDGQALHGARPMQDGSVVRLGDVVMVYEFGALGTDGDAVDRDVLPGVARAMRALRFAAQRAGPDPAPALIMGETGVGKESLARELHRLSGRPGRFVAINCAALSGPLIESQLFGHLRGAFTGAHQAAEGLFVAAHRGTLLLDEIGDLPPDLQPKLLRAIQEGQVLPVGSTRPIETDVRVVAATLHPLAEWVEAGRFRRDLYARLALWELRVPPLRERRADLLMWLERLRRGWLAERPHHDGAVLPLDASRVERLLLAPWPDNLRGLTRCVHRMAMADPQAGLSPSDWTALLGEAPAPTPATPKVRAARPTREELVAALERLGTIKAVARHFGRDRRQVYRWLDTYGLR